jgi:hypothetical protein
MMTEPPPADRVDPEQLLRACLVITDRHKPDDASAPDRLNMPETIDLLDKIAVELGVAPWSAMNLFRRCCAMGNFFAVESNRAMAGIDDAKPGPAIWAAAATAPVHKVIIDGLACDTFDPREFAAAVRRRQD